MARVGIVFGLTLCGITIAGLVSSSTKAPTQFYPMMLGIPILFLGVVALNPHRRRFAMMVSSVIAVLGSVLGLLWCGYELFAIANGGTEADRDSLRLIAAMAATCIAFVGSCAIWFRSLRRKSEMRDQQTHGSVRLPSSLDSSAKEPEPQNSREIA